MVFKGESPRPYDEEGQAGVQKRSRKPGEAPYVPTEEIPDTHPDANPEEALARAQEEHHKQAEGREQEKIAKMLEEKRAREAGQGATKEYQPAPPQVGGSKGIRVGELSEQHRKEIIDQENKWGKRTNPSRGDRTPRYKTEPTHRRETPGTHSEQPTDLQ